MGGGGARGLAHLGVLRVLERAKIPVDLVVGCSMGAMVGTLFAFYQNTADAELRLKRFTRSAGFQRDKYDDLQTMAPIAGADAGLVQTARRFYKLGLFFATTIFKESYIDAAQVNGDIAAIIPEGRIEAAPLELWPSWRPTFAAPRRWSCGRDRPAWPSRLPAPSPEYSLPS